MHLFGHTLDQDYYFELPREGERDTHSISRCSTSHHRDIRAFPRVNRTLSTARHPASGFLQVVVSKATAADSDEAP